MTVCELKSARTSSKRCARMHTYASEPNNFGDNVLSEANCTACSTQHFTLWYTVTPLAQTYQPAGSISRTKKMSLSGKCICMYVVRNSADPLESPNTCVKPIFSTFGWIWNLMNVDLRICAMFSADGRFPVDIFHIVDTWRWSWNLGSITNA